MARPRATTAVAVRRARRGLINRLEPLTQLDLFVNRRLSAARALSELRSGLATADRVLKELEGLQRG
jgi:hypothetical protein